MIGLPPWVALMAVMLAIPSLAYPLRGLVRAAGMPTERESGAALPARDRTPEVPRAVAGGFEDRPAYARLDGHLSGVNIRRRR